MCAHVSVSVRASKFNFCIHLLHTLNASLSVCLCLHLLLRQALKQPAVHAMRAGAVPVPVQAPRLSESGDIGPPLVGVRASGCGRVEVSGWGCGGQWVGVWRSVGRDVEVSKCNCGGQWVGV